MQVKYILGALIVVLILSIFMIIFKWCCSLGGLITGTSSCLIIFFFIMGIFLGFDFNIRHPNHAGWKGWIYDMYIIIGPSFCALQGCLLQHKMIDFIERLCNRW